MSEKSFDKETLRDAMVKFLIDGLEEIKSHVDNCTDEEHDVRDLFYSDAASFVRAMTLDELKAICSLLGSMFIQMNWEDALDSIMQKHSDEVVGYIVPQLAVQLSAAFQGLSIEGLGGKIVD